MAVDGLDCFALIFRSEWFPTSLVCRLYLKYPSFDGQGIVDGVLDHWKSEGSLRYLKPPSSRMQGVALARDLAHRNAVIHDGLLIVVVRHHGAVDERDRN